MDETLVTHQDGAHITLEPLSPTYFDDYLHMLSPTVQALLHIKDLSSERAYLEQRYRVMLSGKTHFYCIIDTTEQKLIGAIEIRHDQDSRGQLYNWINERYWGGGRYQEALALATQAYFHETGERIISAHVDISNKRSWHALQKFGFMHAGIVEGPYGKQYVMLLQKK